ncbi:hypothetical protein AN958_06374 [Leucoagaricus sp. SymC.cos]|nr:hypothetical protein AN958_06374 [Leucoagaricus sp. SymC.cos]
MFFNIWNRIYEPHCSDLSGHIEFAAPQPPQPVATGGYSDIYMGKYGQSDKSKIQVAIKVFRLSKDESKDNSRIIKYLIREAAVWRQLDHGNILPFLGLVSDIGKRGAPALISPWCRSGTIMDYLHNQSQSPRLPLIAEIAQGLQYLHQRNIIHGDLKPSNILINDDGRPLLADFGCSLIVGCQGTTTRRHGTVRYQAPELFEEDIKFTKASDVYAYGVTCSAVWTGVEPFVEFPTDATIILQVLLKNARPRRPSHASEETELVWPLFEACWAGEAEKRLHMEEVADELVKLTEKISESRYCPSLYLALSPSQNLTPSTPYLPASFRSAGIRPPPYEASDPFSSTIVATN